MSFLKLSKLSKSSWLPLVTYSTLHNIKTHQADPNLAVCNLTFLTKMFNLVDWPFSIDSLTLGPETNVLFSGSLASDTILSKFQNRHSSQETLLRLTVLNLSNYTSISDLPTWSNTVKKAIAIPIFTMSPLNQAKLQIPLIFLLVYGIGFTGTSFCRIAIIQL